jgi:lipopolysaccharide export system protein LptC
MTYSRIISWLKIILPLFALAILSTIFLVSQKVDPTTSIPYADIDVDELAREQRISTPNFATVTKDGSAITLHATSAKPLIGVDSLTIYQPRSKIDMVTGGSVEFSAAEGILNQETRLLTLQGDVRLQDTGISLDSRPGAGTSAIRKQYCRAKSGWQDHCRQDGVDQRLL